MKPEVNAVLQEVKASLANQPMAEEKPEVDVNTLRLPDFSTMSIMEATKWCVENGIDKAPTIAKLSGKTVGSVHTAMWKLRNPKRVKVLASRAKKDKAKAKAENPVLLKTKKPKIENGLYEDGMETPHLDALNRQRTRYDLLERSIPTPTESNLEAENRRLKILVEHYESLLFTKGVK